jgi:hypothetical protein
MLCVGGRVYSQSRAASTLATEDCDHEETREEQTTTGFQAETLESRRLLIVFMENGHDQVSLQDINVKYAAVLRGGRHNDSLAFTDINIHAKRFLVAEFETEGDLKNVQALFDELCAGFVNGDNGDTSDPGDNGTTGDIQI